MRPTGSGQARLWTPANGYVTSGLHPPEAAKLTAEECRPRYAKAAALIRSTLAAVALLGLSSAHADETRGILVLDEWGVYSATADQSVTDRNATAGRSTMSRGIKLIERTHRLCARIGTHFGIRYHIRNDIPTDSLLVSIDIEHPPIVDMHGAMQTHDGKIEQIPAHETWYSGWIFVEKRELVPGEWHFIVRHAGEIDLDEKFDVQTACEAPVA
jgi:hypothetical protein